MAGESQCACSMEQRASRADMLDRLVDAYRIGELAALAWGNAERGTKLTASQVECVDRRIAMYREGLEALGLRDGVESLAPSQPDPVKIRPCCLKTSLRSFNLGFREALRVSMPPLLPSGKCAEPSSEPAAAQHPKVGDFVRYFSAGTHVVHVALVIGVEDDDRKGILSFPVRLYVFPAHPEERTEVGPLRDVVYFDAPGKAIRGGLPLPGTWHWPPEEGDERI